MIAKVMNWDGEEVGEIELLEQLFGAPINEALLHQVVVGYLANQRQGTAKAKSRSEVRGGGRKPWRQKGTGRARQGSIRSPLWRKGGVVFGPQPREYRVSMPKRLRRAALCAALSAKLRDGKIVIVDRFPELERPQTKTLVAGLKRFQALNGLLVVSSEQPNLVLSVRNVEKAEAARAVDLNAWQVLRHERLLLSQDAVKRMEEVLHAWN